MSLHIQSAPQPPSVHHTPFCASHYSIWQALRTTIHSHYSRCLSLTQAKGASLFSEPVGSRASMISYARMNRVSYTCIRRPMCVALCRPDALPYVAISRELVVRSRVVGGRNCPLPSVMSSVLRCSDRFVGNSDGNNSRSRTNRSQHSHGGRVAHMLQPHLNVQRFSSYCNTSILYSTPIEHVQGF